MPDLSNHPVFLVMAIGVIAPLIAEIPLGFRVPTVVLEMALGIAVGPHVLGLVQPGGRLGWLGGTLGLAALFFMAGMELDLQRIPGRLLTRAALGWILSLALGIFAAVFLYVLPFTHTPIMVAVALTTTALGTLLPILRDSGELETGFGRLVLAAGAMGEFGPIVVVCLLLTREHSTWLQAGFMLALTAITFLAAFAALKVRSPKILDLLSRTMHASTQLPVRLSILLLAILFLLSEALGLEAVLGAFSAGMIFGVATRGAEGKTMREKIDAVCFGFFVPFFFVTSGINFDLKALLQNYETLLLVPVFLVCFVLVRGAQVFPYTKDLDKGDRLSFALYVSTALPMVVAITHLGVQGGHMHSDTAAALVGAGLISVFLFPALGNALRSRYLRRHAIPKC